MHTIEIVFNAAMFAVVAALAAYLRRGPTLRRGIVCGAGLIVVGAALAFILDGSVFGQMRLWAYAVFLDGFVLFQLAALVYWRGGNRRLATAAGATGLLIAGVAIDAFWIEPKWLDVSHVEVRTTKRSRPIRIAVLADIQTDDIGPFERRVMREVIDATPDIVLFTGDYVQLYDERYDEVATDFHHLVKELRASTPAKLYAVRGDVDRPTRWPRLFEGAGVVLFEDTGTVEEEELLLRGLHRDESGDPSLAVKGDSRFHVVFGHRPDFALGDVDADLLVAGHTHGGQVRLPFLGPVTTHSAVPRAWAAGVTPLSGGRTLIVSRGIGMERHSAPRLRFLCRPELVIVDVVPVKDRT